MREVIELAQKTIDFELSLAGLAGDAESPNSYFADTEHMVPSAACFKNPFRRQAITDADRQRAAEVLQYYQERVTDKKEITEDGKGRVVVKGKGGKSRTYHDGTQSFDISANVFEAVIKEWSEAQEEKQARLEKERLEELEKQQKRETAQNAIASFLRRR